MIFGIGTDLVKISRMEKSLASATFCRRVFGSEELALLQTLSPARKMASAAANFAAKEAFLKAAGRGIGSFELADIQTLRKQSGQPFVLLSGTALAWAEQNALSVHVSLTHEAGLAGAFLLLEQQ